MKTKTELLKLVDRVTAERDAALGREAALKVSLGISANLSELYVEGIESIRAERDVLQQRLTAADERADVLEGLLRMSLVAMRRIYLAGEDRIIELGGDCDSVDTMMESDPAAREIRAALKPSECCTVSAQDRALLEAGDYTPEELFGIGGKPSCPKCAP